MKNQTKQQRLVNARNSLRRAIYFSDTCGFSQIDQANKIVARRRALLKAIRDEK